jgi:hypothetical protein
VTSSSGGFELRGENGDEIRLLVHTQLGYSIAVPGRPRIVAPTSETPSYDVLLQMDDAPIELGFRMDEVPTDGEAADILPALVTSYAVSRARNPDTLQPDWLRGRPRANGADGAMRVTYELRGEDPAAMEFLAIHVKHARKGLHALHMTVRYRRGETSPFAWSNLRAALLFHHSWDPAKPPSMNVWPERSVFVPRSVRFELSDGAMRQAEEKAAEVSGLLPGDSERLAGVLIDFTNGMYAPSAPRPDELEGEVARAIVGCLPSKAAEVLLRNFHEVESLHDFRGWLWQQFWAVANRTELKKSN